MAIDDTDLLGYADGQLEPDRRAEVEAAVAASPELARRLSLMRASALPYTAAFEAQRLPPLPQELSTGVMELVRADSRRERSRRPAWPALTAAFAAGVLCCAVALGPLGSGTTLLSPAARIDPWIQAVADYQQLYSRATVMHVVEDSTLSARVITGLRTDDGISVMVPDLRFAGLSFKRVQRLSFRDQPVVQMVYLPERGEPVALCITRDRRADQAPRTGQIGELSTVTWRQGQLGYVLLGKAPAQDLMDLGRHIASGHLTSLYSRRAGAPRNDAA